MFRVIVENLLFRNQIIGLVIPYEIHVVSLEKLLLLFDARESPYIIDRFTLLAAISSILRGATIGR